MSLNWKIFGVKYDKQEQGAFEQLSYLLFCAEFENHIGLFRYKNQTGIETEPIEKDGRHYGFQAKYFSSSINKDDITASIQKAKRENPHLDEVYLYTNQELSESSTQGKKKPQYQLDIENEASALGIVVQWRVPSHMEIQLSRPENKYIYDMFFSLDANEGDLIDEVLEHNNRILQTIQTEIVFGDKIIKIDRNSIVKKIATSIQEKKHLIISGEGGCGKTAVFKEFYKLHSKEYPICIFKASELNVGNVNEIFNLNHKFLFSQYINAYKDESLKIFVIDSAEKLAEISNSDYLANLIGRLIDNAWTIVFTTRYAYLNDLSFIMMNNYSLACERIDIPLIDNEKLQSLSGELNFSLPNNQKFIQRLQNLFYLREYISHYQEINKAGSYKEFVNLLWKKKIQNIANTKDCIHLEREKCLISIAKKRCDSGLFYVESEGLSGPALSLLIQDEILGYNETHGGYFITHDIYEEWALDKIVSRSFNQISSAADFFAKLGDSLPMRRAFRLWMSNMLFECVDDIAFLIASVSNDEISNHWRDEILVVILLSEYSETFFEKFEQQIIANDFKILKRILFLLRIACTDVSIENYIESIMPKGKGWQETISFIYKYRQSFLEDNLKLVLPILKDWTSINKNGTTTRLSGLLLLDILKKTESDTMFFIGRNIEETFFQVIYNSAQELKPELKEIFDKVVKNHWTDGRDPYEDFCSKILEKPYLAFDLINALPLSVIQLCDLFWKKKPLSEDDFWGESDTMENHYGLVDRFDFDYHPSSANQTPIKWLLQVAFLPTLDFIIAFTNQAVDCYRKSDYGQRDVKSIKLYVDDNEISQYVCDAFWNMYRGTGTPVVPNVLQCMHMALESVLLDSAQMVNQENFQPVLLKILTQSKSASLTSVVCSVVLANPEKFYNIALILFKTIEFFHYDLIRCGKDSTARSLYSIGYEKNTLGGMLYFDERLKNCEDKHRKFNLESLFLNYQFFGVKGFSEEQNSEFISKLYDIIDVHKSNPVAIELCGMQLARMDRRNLKSRIIPKENNQVYIEFEPKKVPEDVKKKSDETLNRYSETFKYTSLSLWSNFLFAPKDQKKDTKQESYDKNPLLALEETKKLIEEINSGREDIRLMYSSTPFYVCSKLLLEYRDSLSAENKEFCKNIVLSAILCLFDDNYGYQIGDGVEAAIRAIPILMNEYPEQAEDFALMFVLILLDEYPIGEYKRICDYAIESIRISKLWDNNFDIAQSILSRYIKLKPIYHNIIAEKKNGKRWAKISKKSVLEELEKINNELDDAILDVNEALSLDNHGKEIILELIPSNTKDEKLSDIYAKVMSSFASQLFEDRRDAKDKSMDFSLRLRIFKVIARFLLQRNVDEIDKYLESIIPFLQATEETAYFLEELITIEDYLNKHDQFWHIWTSLYSKIKDLCTSPQDYYLKNVLVNYLLAWQYWKEGIKEWRSLKKNDVSFFTKASEDIGNIPATLYSVARVLNTIGSNYDNEGIEWIYTIVSKNPSLELEDLEKHTLYYMENFMRKYLFSNRQRIKETIRLKRMVINILNFMVEKGSSYGYLLRESIL